MRVNMYEFISLFEFEGYRCFVLMSYVGSRKPMCAVVIIGI